MPLVDWFDCFSLVFSMNLDLSTALHQNLDLSDTVVYNFITPA